MLVFIDIMHANNTARRPHSDSGPGIEPALAQRLFQPFSAGEGGTGTGLGLAICHEIVQSLGGRIELAPRRQNGRVAGLDAIVTLPL